MLKKTNEFNLALENASEGDGCCILTKNFSVLGAVVARTHHVSGLSEVSLRHFSLLGSFSK